MVQCPTEIELYQNGVKNKAMDLSRSQPSETVLLSLSSPTSLTAHYNETNMTALPLLVDFPVCIMNLCLSPT